MHAPKLQAFSQLLLLKPESIASDWGDEVHISPMVWPAGWTQEETSERNDVAHIFPMALSAKELRKRQSFDYHPMMFQRKLSVRTSPILAQSFLM